MIKEDIENIAYPALVDLNDFRGREWQSPLVVDLAIRLEFRIAEDQEGTLGTPKQVLFDFIEVFSKKLMADGDYFDYLQSLVQDTESRDIMMWSFHESQQKLLADMGLD